MNETRYNMLSKDFGKFLGLNNRSLEELLAKYEKTNGKLLSPAIVRSILENNGYTYQKRVITFQMLKGGVGKTCLAKNIGIRASHYGYRVLFIDLDPQGNITTSLGVTKSNFPVMSNWINDEIKNFDDMILKLSDFISLVPSSLNNEYLSDDIQRKMKNLANVFGPIFKKLHETYDLIICDCPPRFGYQISSAYLASDTVITPVTPDDFGCDGLDAMLKLWDDLNLDFSKKVNRRSVINRYDPRKKVQTEVVRDIINKHKDILYDEIITESSDLYSTNKSSKSLWEFKESGRNGYSELDKIVRLELGLNKGGVH